MSFSCIFVLLSLPLVCADGWDDFSNNLASDLAPILSLFGEQITKQYLSESISPIDYFIFAMAPMGILTAVVSAIRLCGSPSLRALIGRAQEGGGVAEAELCSSTSRDVCELYNNGGIARVFGRPKILEIVYDPDSQDFNETAGIYTFQDYLARHRGRGMWKSNRGETDTEKDNDDEAFKATFAPNLSLNIGTKKQPAFVFWVVGLGGLILQAGVLIFAVIVTYYLEWEKDNNRPGSYACPLVIIGTLLLCSGMFLCAFLVGQSTDEKVWHRKVSNSNSDKSSLFWVQPGGQVIGDQTFDAFCHSDCDDRKDCLKEYTISWKRNRSEKSEFAVWATIGITVSGFVLQFTGLRGTHSAVSVVQLGITMLMSAARAALRMQRLQPEANCFAIDPDKFIGHELDWLALRLGREDKNIQKDVPSSVPSPGCQGYFWKFCSAHNHTDRISKQSPSSSKHNTAAKLLAYRTRLAEITESLATSKSTRQARNFEIEMVEVRQEAHRLAMAIESAINIIFSKDSRIRDKWKDADHIWWEIDCVISEGESIPEENAKKQTLHLELCRDLPVTTLWRLRNKLQLEGILGLWLWSLKSSDPASGLTNLQNDLEGSPAAALNQTIATCVLNQWLGKENINLTDERLCLEPSRLGEPRVIWQDRTNRSRLSLCSHELFRSFIASILEILDDIGVVDSQEANEPYLVERSLVSQVVELFTETKLGSRQDALLCILPPIISPVRRTPLSSAACHGNCQVVEELLKSPDIEPDAKDRDERTALWWAVRNRHEAVVKLLLGKNEVHPDAKDKDSRTPLWWAARNGHDRVVKLLLDTDRVTPDTKDKDGRTPLSWAAQNGNDEVVELLLGSSNVDPNSKDKKEQTPLSWAAQNGHDMIVELLQKRS